MATIIVSMVEKRPRKMVRLIGVTAWSKKTLWPGPTIYCRGWKKALRHARFVRSRDVTVEISDGGWDYEEAWTPGGAP